jgi:hypothetical protein
VPQAPIEKLLSLTESTEAEIRGCWNCWLLYRLY